MNALVPIALFGWPLVVAALYAKLPKHRAMIVAILVGWLCLPVVNDPVLGMRWSKIRTACGAVLLVALVLDAKTVFSFRPRLIDIPMIAWCLAPFCSSMVNDLGIYDAISQTFEQFIAWGTPYLLGRVYLTSLERVRDLAVGVVWSGVIYAPFCLLETRISPQFHTWVYGYFQHSSFVQSIRYGGFRPMVFLEHGLAVGAWLCTATLTTFWLWYSKSGKILRLGSLKIPFAAATGLLFVTSVMSRSLGAVGLELIGSGALFLCSWSRWRMAAIVLLMVPVLYVYGRVWGGWTGQSIVDAVGGTVDKERGESFAFRLENENILVRKAMEREVFGWGGWGRSRVYDEDGTDITTTDGLWIIVLGDRGLFGLFALGACMLLPAALLFWRVPPRSWAQPEYAAPAALAMTLVLYCVDGLANAMINPIFMLMAGGLGNVLKPIPGNDLLRKHSREAQAKPAAVTYMPPRARQGEPARAIVKYGPAPQSLVDRAARDERGDDASCPEP